MFSSLDLLVDFCEFLVKIMNIKCFEKIKKNLNSWSKIINLALQRLDRQSFGQLRGK